MAWRKRCERCVFDDGQRCKQRVIARLEEPGVLDLEIASATDAQRSKNVTRLVDEPDCSHGRREDGAPDVLAGRHNRRMSSTLRCRDLKDTLMSVSALYGVPARDLVHALPSAVSSAEVDLEDPVGVLADALSAELGTTPQTPSMIHYFHGTRAYELCRFAHDGLRPLEQMLDPLWREIAALVPELSDRELRDLRADLGAGVIAPFTYSWRIADS